jgi:hypothetical protein
MLLLIFRLMKIHPAHWVSAFLALLPLGVAAGGKPLNQLAVHYQYNDGDFPAVIAAIDEFTRAHKTYSRADSIFVAKHLAVVFTANPDTREKGKYYMYQMLDLIPSGDLVDMYVSDEIERIFSYVKKEYDVKNRERLQAAQANQANQEARAVKKTPLWKNPWIWGGTAVVAAGALTAAIALREDGKPRPEYVVP